MYLSIFISSNCIASYPNGGGSYKVSKENLGTKWALIAGASLTIDYVLTVAVSASTAAITLAFPKALTHKVIIIVLIIIVMCIDNLRGIRESSKWFSLPTYFFIMLSIIMIIYGVIKFYILGYTPIPIKNVPEAAGDISILLILRAFAGGCTASTGVEAISDGMPKEEHPSNQGDVVTIVMP